MSAYYLGHSVWDILIGKPEMPNALVQGRRMKVLIRGRGGNCKGGLFLLFPPISVLRKPTVSMAVMDAGVRLAGRNLNPKAG